jgi:hypothetical protein
VKRKSAVAVWRDAVRDSGLDSTAKLVAFCLSTYFDVSGRTYGGRYSPSRTTLARGCSLSDRAVDAALVRIEASGFLTVERTTGGNARTNVYNAQIASTANEVRRSEWSTANLTTPNGESDDPNGERGSQESVSDRKRTRGGGRGNANATASPAAPSAKFDPDAVLRASEEAA